MQPHEGPRRDPAGEKRERARQRSLTRSLLVGVVLLGGLLAVMLFERWA